MQPGGRRRNCPILRGKDGLISFTVNSLRHSGDIRRKRNFPDFGEIHRPIESDHPIAFVANLNDCSHVAMDRKGSPQGK